MNFINTNPLLGAILGDLSGKPYEGKKYYQLPEKIELMPEQTDFTDDTVLTIAVADALLSDKNFERKIHNYANEYPHRGYGGNFKKWIKSANPQPYNSFGNGAAMRVSPVAWAAESLDEVLQLAEDSAIVTHNNPEGIKGAKAVAGAIFLARTGASKDEIKNFVISLGYRLNFELKSIRPFFSGGASSQATIPVSIVAFLESSDFVSSLYNAIFIGGDTDTQAAIAGSIAVAFYNEVPQDFVDWAYGFLPQEFLDVMMKFESKFLNK